MKKPSTWLLFLYGLPTRQSSARVNLWRKLKQSGAIQLKSSAYVLPDEPAHYERFQWLAKQIQDGGGEATLIRVAEIDGLSRQQIEQLFNEARTADYHGLAEQVRGAIQRHRRKAGGELKRELEKARRRYNEIRAIDFFESPAAEDVKMMFHRAEKMLLPPNHQPSAGKLHKADFQNRTWLTRPRPGIDRAGSAWLIRKFIDPKAKFAFGMSPARFPRAVPFDMAEADFSHHGDDCTFETFVKRFGIRDSAVIAIAEMVHDADLGDGKFQRCECIGLDAVLSGWERSGLSDDELLAHGIECFEGLYGNLHK